MIYLPDLVVVLAGAGLAAFFAGSETGAYVVSRVRLQHLARSGDARARRLVRLLADLPGFVTGTLIWTNLFLYAAAAACASVYETLGVEQPDLAGTATLALPLFVFAELVPKTLYRLRGEALMLRSTAVLRAAGLLSWPLAKLLSLFAALARGLFRLPEPFRWTFASRRAVRSQFAELAAGGALSAGQRQLVENVLAAGALPASAAGLRAGAAWKGEVIYLPEEAAVADLLARADASRARTAVLSGPPGSVTGVVSLMKAVLAAPDTPLSELARRPERLEEPISVLRALEALRRSGRSVGVLSRSGILVSEGGLARFLMLGGGAGRDQPRRRGCRTAGGIFRKLP